MELTDEEKKIFRVENYFKDVYGEYGRSASDRIERRILDSYSSNSDAVKITYGYIKRILLEVAKKRNLVIQDDLAFDIDELLKQIIEVPPELEDFDVLSYKDYTNLEKYLKEKTKGKTSSELEEFRLYFNGFGEIHDFMSDYIPEILNKIDVLDDEADKVVEKWTDLDEEMLKGEDWDESDWEALEKEMESKKENNEVVFLDDEEFVEDEDFVYIEGIKMKKMPKVTDEELISFIKYINTYPEIIKCKTNANKAEGFLSKLSSKTKLQEFYSNPKFLQDFKKIMEHDLKSHTYYFHGTQDLESADMIMKEGLGMMRESLSTTAYPEFSMDNVILYSRGFMGEIGSSAIVIIDEPCKDNRKEKIVKPLEKEEKIHFSPSGLQGLTGEPHYIVDTKYIVGYVDKENKAIIFNPRYYDYNRFQTQSSDNRPKHLPYSEERIAEGVLRFDQKELEVPDKQIDK